ncbi:MAG TPA: amidohydrolase family protein, partial [Actinomycetota bacterium]|nr:amidohydrolase family protein [Actinomycetota bacterium]
MQRVGSGEPPQADRVVELPGTTIIPGFVDTHVHLTGTGVHHQAPEVASARSTQELIETLRKVVKDKDGPVLVHGYDESKWDRPELPTIDELGGVTELPLAVVRVDGHLTLANMTGLDLSGALDASEGVERDAAQRPTGKVTKVANTVLRHWFQQHLADHDVEELQLDAASLAVAHGVTCIHEMSMPKERGMRDLEILLRHRARLPLDVVPYVATTDVGRVLDLGLRRIGGDLPVDGS